MRMMSTSTNTTIAMVPTTVAPRPNKTGPSPAMTVLIALMP